MQDTTPGGRIERPFALINTEARSRCVGIAQPLVARGLEIVLTVLVSMLFHHRGRLCRLAQWVCAGAITNLNA